jgi:hypothetical protein
VCIFSRRQWTVGKEWSSGKVVSVLNEASHKDACRCGGIAQALASAIDGDEWSASTSGPFTPTTNRVGRTAAVDVVTKKNKLHLSGTEPWQTDQIHRMKYLIKLRRLCIGVGFFTQHLYDICWTVIFPGMTWNILTSHYHFFDRKLEGEKRQDKLLFCCCHNKCMNPHAQVRR